MNPRQKVAGIVQLTFIFAFCGVAQLDAQPFTIPWFTIDGGGGYAAGGTFEVQGTIGQHDAGPIMSGGSFTLTGGFWVAGGAAVTTVPNSYTLFRGILVDGVLDDVFASDDIRMRFNPGITINAAEAPVWLIFDAALPSDNPGNLRIVMESQAGTPGLTATLEAFNWTVTGYDVVDVSAATFNSDSIVNVDLSSGISDYVEAATGAVRTRVGWRKTGITLNFPWEVRLDQMVWIIE